MAEIRRRMLLANGSQVDCYQNFITPTLGTNVLTLPTKIRCSGIAGLMIPGDTIYPNAYSDVYQATVAIGQPLTMCFYVEDVNSTGYCYAVGWSTSYNNYLTAYYKNNNVAPSKSYTKVTCSDITDSSITVTLGSRLQTKGQESTFSNNLLYFYW